MDSLPLVLTLNVLLQLGTIHKVIIRFSIIQLHHATLRTEEQPTEVCRKLEQLLTRGA